MSEEKKLNAENTENAEQELKEEELNDVSGGIHIYKVEEDKKKGFV